MRLQLALNVSDLDASIEFYEKMFDTPVAKVKPGYANFAIENPPLKLVLLETGEAADATSLNHLGVEVEDASQVTAAEERIREAGVETSGIDDTICCFAEKTETWVEGPGTKWEWYVKTADAEGLENRIVSHTDTGGTANSACCVGEEATTEAAEQNCC